MLRLRRDQEPKERVAREEWDFIKLLEPEGKEAGAENERACCYYEYARESTYIMETLKSPPAYDNSDQTWSKLKQSPLTYALPVKVHGTNCFDGPWLHKDLKWRKQFLLQMAENWEKLCYARTLDKAPNRAFHVGMSPQFPAKLWTENAMRALHPNTGLETLLITIDWSNFDDKEVASEIKQWVKKERPKGVGVHSKKGKKNNVWQMHLMKLRALRLRHYYPFEEIATISQDDKFFDRNELNRPCKAACKSLHDLFPFLPVGALPLAWQCFLNG